MSDTPRTDTPRTDKIPLGYLASYPTAPELRSLSEELERENADLRWLIRQLVNDLPANRDWLNPDYERMMRDLCGAEPAKTLNPKRDERGNGTET